MSDSAKLLDTVALTEDLPEEALVRGQVGTVVEVLDHDVIEVEFCDNEGRTYGMAPVKSQQLIVLHHEPAAAE